MEEKRGNGLLWALVGCGGLLFVGLCVALGAGVYLAYPRLQGGVAGPNAPSTPVVAPGQPVQPVPPGGPVGPGANFTDKPPPGAIPILPPPGFPARPIELNATITSVTGSLSGRVSRACRMVVEPPNANQRCRTQITCDTVLVYGGPQAGYFACRFDVGRGAVSGVDDQMTQADGDSAMSVDTDARRLQVRDDAGGPLGEFAIEASF